MSNHKYVKGGHAEYALDLSIKAPHIVGGREACDGGGAKLDAEAKLDLPLNTVPHSVGVCDSNEATSNHEADHTVKYFITVFVKDPVPIDVDHDEPKLCASKVDPKHDCEIEKHSKDPEKSVKPEGHHEDVKFEPEVPKKKPSYNAVKDPDPNKDHTK